MLPNPDTASNAAPRERILASLLPKGQAIFLFIEHLIQVEQDFQPEKGQTLTISWDRGCRTQDVYGEALKGNTSMLPVPEGGRYQSFCWLIKRDRGNLGSSDIRIVERGPILVFEANGGTLKGTKSWWEGTVKDINYPILVEDSDRTVIYTNPAY